MTLSFIIKFAKVVINKRGSRGSLNLSKIRSKNKQVCENAVTRLYGSCMLRVMAPVHDQLRVPLNQCALRAEIPISGHFLCHRNSDLARLKVKAYLSADFVYPSSVWNGFSIKGLSDEKLAYSRNK